MIITNNQGLPDNIVNAVKRAFHKKGDYSVTELEKSPREYWLLKRHDAEIYADVSDMLWMLFGSAIHKILQEGATPDQLTEEFLTVNFDGKVLSGTTDLYENKGIKDYKTTSVWTVIYGSRWAEYEKQVNCYSYLFQEAGFEVDRLEIVLLLKDWSRSKARFDPKYPQSGVMRVDVQKWPKERVEAYMKERIAVLEAERNTPDKDLPLCTSEERWQRETVWKCMKEGGKRSIKNFGNKFEAETYCAENKLKLVEMAGENVKCRDYCYACTFCSQFMAGAQPPVASFDDAVTQAQKETANNGQ